MHKILQALLKRKVLTGILTGLLILCFPVVALKIAFFDCGRYTCLVEWFALLFSTPVYWIGGFWFFARRYWYGLVLMSALFVLLYMDLAVFGMTGDWLDEFAGISNFALVAAALVIFSLPVACGYLLERWLAFRRAQK